MVKAAKTGSHAFTGGILLLCGLLVTGCETNQTSVSSAATQALRGDYQTGQTSIVTQANTGPNEFNMIEVIEEPGNKLSRLITVGSGRFNPSSGTTSFRFKKPYSCNALSKTTDLSPDVFRDEILISSCRWIPVGSVQVFKPLRKANSDQ